MINKITCDFSLELRFADLKLLIFHMTIVSNPSRLRVDGVGFPYFSLTADVYAE